MLLKNHSNPAGWRKVKEAEQSGVLMFPSLDGIPLSAQVFGVG